MEEKTVVRWFINKKGELYKMGYRLKKNEATPKKSSLAKLAKALDIAPEQLMK